MSDPTKFIPGYSYSGWQASYPIRPLPAQQVDNDFANASRSINQTIDALKDIRRSDGKLKNGIVTPDALSPVFSIGFTFRGTWIEGTDYYAGDGVVYDNVFYAASVSHTATMADAPGNDSTWRVLFSLSDILVAGALSMPTAQFQGNGVDRVFDLDFMPLSSENLLVVVGGVVQDVSEYSVSGTQIEFFTAPPVVPIQIRGFATTASMVVPENGSVTPEKLAPLSVTEPKLADGATSLRTLSPSVQTAIFGSAFQVKSFAELKAVSPTVRPLVVLTGTRRAGIFAWQNGDFSTQAAIDTSEGVYVKSDAFPITAGAWVRVGAQGDIDPRWFDVAGDYNTNDTVAFKATLAFAAAFRRTIAPGEMNVRVSESIDFFEGIRFRAPGGAKINTWIMTADKANMRPGYKHLVSGFNIWLSGTATKTYTTDRTANYASFTYGISYLFTTPCDIEGVGIIQDMNVYTVDGVLTTAANDGRSNYDVGMVVRSYGSRVRKCNIFGYWATGKNGFVLHSQQNLANVDSDYFTATESFFAGVALIASNTGTQGLTGSTWTSCEMYNGADHHAATVDGSGDYTKPAIYIDGDNGVAGIRGHCWNGGNLRTRANDAIVRGKTDGTVLNFSATETPPLIVTIGGVPTGIPNADQQGVIRDTPGMSGRLRTNIGSMSSVAGLGLDAVAAVSPLISIGGQNQDEIVVAKGGLASRLQPGVVATGMLSSPADAILRAATGSVVRAQVNTTTVFTADATRFSVSSKRLRLGGVTGSILLIAGVGSPEGIETAPAGSLFFREDGTAGTLRYKKNTGTGNTGWVAEA